ncbi:MAG TPA: amino acid adenylation domain-containing protein, partial [Longimicrobiaceae bacterium]
EHACATVCLDRDRAEIEGESGEAPAEEATPESLAYVIYTSGSTGRPKGVLVTHANVVRLFRATEAWFGFGADDVWTLFHSYAFDFSVWEIWGALLYGGMLVVVPYLTSRSPEAFHRLLVEEGVTVLNQTPSAFRQLIAAEASEAGELALRLVVFGGEALELESLRPWMERHGEERPRLVNMYGITETTVHVTYRRITGADLEAGRGSVIGCAIPDLRIYLLDAHGEPVPVGVAGEMYVGGAGVGRGYLNREELTRERFLADPFRAGERVYRSGDLARYRADGELEYLGRADQQVKVRGFRIEPGEIEAVLGRHPAVREAVAVVREDAPGDRRIVAYVTGADSAAAELRAHASAHLPEYMVPSAFVVLETLPLTPNGKVDRKALPAPEYGSGEGRYEAARAEVEEVLCGVWAEVLGVERVGVRESFFELGGHSLLATRVVARIREVLAVELPLRELFEAPTVAGLAERVEALRRAGQPTLPPVLPTERTGALPLSFAQQRLWLVDRLEPGSAAYNIPVAWRLCGVPDVGALRVSVGGLARRHETLRTTFAEHDGVPVQVVHPPAPVELPVVELGGLPAAAREPEALRLAGEEALRPFDLSRGPLMRGTLLRLGAEDHVLLFTLHHIVSDGWSMDVLVRDVGALYAAHARGEEPALPVLPVQYADYALWQRAWLQGEELDRQLAWWRERLAGAPALLELPTDRPRPAVQGHRGAVRSLRIDAATAGELRALCRHEGVTVFMTLLAGFAVLLGRYSGEADVVVGAPVATRGRRETEGLIGFFLNTLALRTDLSGDPSFRELLGRVREATLGAYDHQDLPFERILEEIQPARTLSHSPLFQVMLNLQNLDDQAPLDLAGVRAEPFGGGVPVAKYDLTLYAGERDGEIRLDLVYNADLFEDARMEDALGHLRTLLAAVAAHPELRVSRIPLLTEEERRARSVRARGIGTGRPFEEFARGDIEQTIPDRFEAQVRLHPDRLAVRTRTTRLTYAELNRAAEAVARAILRTRPAAAERVALLFEHDAAMIVGILGVLRAGKTYVPIDPLYPRERSAYVLEDSGAAALLTNRANLALARELARERVPIVDLDAVDAADDAPVAFPRVRPDEAAYILYTSGSTGRPKGVVQSHRNVLHFIRVYTNNLRIGPGDRLTLFSSYTFDASVMAVYGALLNGAALLPLGWREESASGVAEWMRREGITLYHSTPTVFRHLVEELGGEERFPEVRLVVLGGEEAQRRDVDAFRAHFAPGAVLVNGLGPTESTVTLQSFIGRDTPVRRGTVPVGYPVEDTEVVLRNGLGEQVAVYGVGEIEIQSAHVALGYWRRPEQTAAAFGQAPRAGVRSYRTGDLGRRLPDGSLEFVGRTDFQVKVRGVRVELGEIEAAMRAHPGVRDAVVAAREEGGAGGRRLAGYVVAAEGAEVPAPAEMRAWLRERLPDYMVPAVFVALEALPLTPGGKTDRLALPAPERAEDAGARAPRTPIEEVLAQIWAEVLGLGHAGVGEDFFELGGHSLLATRLVSRV